MEILDLYKHIAEGGKVGSTVWSKGLNACFVDTGPNKQAFLMSNGNILNPPATSLEAENYFIYTEPDKPLKERVMVYKNKIRRKKGIPHVWFNPTEYCTNNSGKALKVGGEWLSIEDIEKCWEIVED